MGIGALLLMSAIGALASAGASIYSAKKNYQATVDTNNQNIQMQKETNAQNQYNIEHAHQIEMADLQAAGLNPVLTATGGNGAPIQALNSPKAQAPQVDLSGVGSAIQGMTNMAMMSMMMRMRQDVASERNNTLTAIAKGHDAQSAANAVLRKDTLDRLYQRKASSLANEGKAHINSAKKYEKYEDSLTDDEIEKLLKEFSGR